MLNPVESIYLPPRSYRTIPLQASAHHANRVISTAPSSTSRPGYASTTSVTSSGRVCRCIPNQRARLTPS